MEKLNLGCGNDYKEGWVNVECNKNFMADIYHDLNKLPYPFKENTFDEILASMVLEHLENPIKVLKEIIKISKKNARLKIIVPHAFSYASKTDIQHKTNFTENSFDKELLEEYELKQLILIKKGFLFNENLWKKYIPFKKYLKIFLNGIYDDLCFEFVINK